MNSKLTLNRLMGLSVIFMGISFANAAGMNQGKNTSSNMLQPDFSLFDLNGDKVISAEEFKQMRMKRAEDKTAEGKILRNRNQADNFTDIDTDGDGAINREEFQLHQKNAVNMQMKEKAKIQNQMNRQMQEKAQKNNSQQKQKMNKVSKQNRENLQNKMVKRQQPSFSEFDSNADQLISKDEFNALRSERIKARSEDGRALKNVDRSNAFASFDKNKDGMISEAEFSAHQRYANPGNKKSTKQSNYNGSSKGQGSKGNSKNSN
ncbi:MAG: hypothetical protein OQK77_10955 [Psychromonas sp.]|nr:hypothetical protein [Psychromonas sp.]